MDTLINTIKIKNMNIENIFTFLIIVITVFMISTC